MRAVGEGEQLFSVRVDLFTETDDHENTTKCVESLCELMGIPTGEWETGEIAADRGTGIERAPVVGLHFWVRGRDVGEAAATALATARRVGVPFGVGPRYYDIALAPAETQLATDPMLRRVGD